MTDAESNANISALRSAFAAAAAERRAMLLPFMTAGLPDLASSVDLFSAMTDAGADGFEIGIPYSDPLMDGPTIQEAGIQAIGAGATPERSLQIAGAVVEKTGLPVFVMTYVNPILSVGIETFVQRVADTGATGMIVADLPVDEAATIAEASRRHGVGLVLFAAPTTTDVRLQRVIEQDPLFVYAVARLGVTGVQTTAENQLGALAARIKSTTDIPVVAGVGISNPEMAAAAAAQADGVIVGSALVRRVLDAADGATAAGALHAAVVDLAEAVRQR